MTIEELLIAVAEKFDGFDRCEWNGGIFKDAPTGFYVDTRAQKPCPRCKGTGWEDLHDPYGECEECSLKGTVTDYSVCYHFFGTDVRAALEFILAMEEEG